jgi:hypothetical protein
VAVSSFVLAYSALRLDWLGKVRSRDTTRSGAAFRVAVRLRSRGLCQSVPLVAAMPVRRSHLWRLGVVWGLLSLLASRELLRADQRCGVGVGGAVRRLSVGFSLVWLQVALFAGACGGSAVHGQDASDGSSAGEAGATGNPGGDVSAAEDAAAGAGGAVASAPDNSCKRKQDAAPGTPVGQPSQQGSGACSSTTLADAIAQVRALRPDLSDIVELYVPNPDVGGDGSYIYAFAEADGGFALVFKRGGGDCPSGCTSNDYWYFETDAACRVQAVGETHDSAPCTPAGEQPRWGVPAAVAPRYICGADPSTVQLSGDYDLVTCGSATACALAGPKSSPRPLPSTLSLSIQQDPADLTQGTVTLDGTGEPLLDAVAFPAKFDQQSFAVHAEYSNLPAACPEQWQLDFTYDFEGFGPRTLHFFQTQTPDCKSAPNAYCKGGLDADLGDAQSVHE